MLSKLAWKPSTCCFSGVSCLTSLTRLSLGNEELHTRSTFPIHQSFQNACFVKVTLLGTCLSQDLYMILSYTLVTSQAQDMIFAIYYVQYTYTSRTSSVKSLQSSSCQHTVSTSSITYFLHDIGHIQRA